jgi:peptidyl-prolyl cis-trans isomerase C
VRRALSVLLLVFVSACSKDKAPASSESASAPAGNAPAATAPATAGKPGEGNAPAQPGAADPPPASAFIAPVPAQLPNVLAKINGESLNKAEFEKTVSAIERQNGAPVPPAERDRIFRAVLDQMIATRLLAQESKARKITVTDAEVDEQIAGIQKRFGSEEAFKSAMAAQKVTLEQIKSDTRQDLMINKMLEAELGPKIAVTPDQVAKVYKENPTAFQVPERVRASHILIAVPADAPADVKQAALAKANSVLQSARAGKDFGALAKEFSQDPGSAAQGGELPVFTAQEMVKPFSDAAFKLKPGAISDVVETQFGYHIIKVAEKQAGRTVKLEEAKPDIERQLRDVNRTRETQAFLQSLRQRGKVEVFI